MKNLNKISISLAFSFIFITLGCDIKARLADLPPNASIIDFTTLSDNKLKGISPIIEKRKPSTYYIEEQCL